VALAGGARDLLAAQGLKKAGNPSRVKEEDLITLRRVIYQSMLLSFHRGGWSRTHL